MSYTYARRWNYGGANYGEAAATLILQSFPNLELTTLL